VKYILGLALLATAASAQPVQPVPTVSAPVSALLASAPHIDIDNGVIAARIAPPDLAKGFYRGTRFDQAGVITSLKLNGREFYGPWFDRTAPEVLDYAYDAGGARQTRITKTSVTFTQALQNAGTGYIYEKTLRLVPGKPQLVIEHRPKNTGSKPISTTVYDHNFLRLAPDSGIRVTFPFPVSAAPPAADLMTSRPTP
jgi:hypothetical protein